jgi:very-short-patch-repair endonuclease
MPLKRIITGQPIADAIKERAKKLRRLMTPAEQKLWERLRAGQLEGIHFRRQQVIDRFIVDFYCHQADLVIEVDGGIHLEQVEYDCERVRQLEARGLRVLRFTNNEINQQMEIVLANILDACKPGRK